MAEASGQELEAQNSKEDQPITFPIYKRDKVWTITVFPATPNTTSNKNPPKAIKKDRPSKSQADELIDQLEIVHLSKDQDDLVKNGSLRIDSQDSRGHKYRNIQLQNKSGQEHSYAVTTIDHGGSLCQYFPDTHYTVLLRFLKKGLRQSYDSFQEIKGGRIDKYNIEVRVVDGDKRTLSPTSEVDRETIKSLHGIVIEISQSFRKQQLNLYKLEAKRDIIDSVVAVICKHMEDWTKRKLLVINAKLIVGVFKLCDLNKKNLDTLEEDMLRITLESDASDDQKESTSKLTTELKDEAKKDTELKPEEIEKLKSATENFKKNEQKVQKELKESDMYGSGSYCYTDGKMRKGYLHSEALRALFDEIYKIHIRFNSVIHAICVEYRIGGKLLEDECAKFTDVFELSPNEQIKKVEVGLTKRSHSDRDKGETCIGGLRFYTNKDRKKQFGQQFKEKKVFEFLGDAYLGAIKSYKPIPTNEIIDQVIDEAEQEVEAIKIARAAQQKSTYKTKERRARHNLTQEETEIAELSLEDGSNRIKKQIENIELDETSDDPLVAIGFVAKDQNSPKYIDSEIYGKGLYHYTGNITSEGYKYSEQSRAKSDEIHKIHIKCSSVIHAIKVEYKNAGMGDWHGNTKFTGSEDVLALDSNETITKITIGVNEKGIAGLKFHTNQDKSKSFPEKFVESRLSEFECPENSCLGAIKVRLPYSIAAIKKQVIDEAEQEVKAFKDAVDKLRAEKKNTSGNANDPDIPSQRVTEEEIEIDELPVEGGIMKIKDRIKSIELVETPDNPLKSIGFIPTLPFEVKDDKTIATPRSAQKKKRNSGFGPKDSPQSSPRGPRPTFETTPENNSRSKKYSPSSSSKTKR